MFDQSYNSNNKKIVLWPSTYNNQREMAPETFTINTHLTSSD